MCYSGVPYWVGAHDKREGRYRPVAREQVASASTGSIGAGAGMRKFQCVCSPTKHPGSFRCRHHHSDYKWVAPLGIKPSNHLGTSVAKAL
uniref:Uncharacterized protein LOC104234552 n=1 Tax=Nicotiana sylvestris TaxID=4096 RepID=A0A1U7XHK5_NICSY|nr:PREDICTED: uncharacterized protein LOC104234552 [Nicotiana sylvestris]